jgi:His-Xaa-Ser system protein HxsD
MKDSKLPIIELGNGGFQIRVDLSVYTIDAVTSTSYKYTDRFYIHQETTDDNAIKVSFESKSKEIPITIDVAKQYCNDLIDQQVRYMVNRDFGLIRDLIVEEAFKPVNNDIKHATKTSI